VTTLNLFRSAQHKRVSEDFVSESTTDDVEVFAFNIQHKSCIVVY